jgi:DNA-binding transcriptional ArsR family regulator
VSRGRATDPLWGAIGDPTRRRIVDVLLVEGEATATEVAKRVPVSRQAVAKHLDILDRAGLVSSRRLGREVRYAVEVDRLDAVSRSLTELADAWEDRLSRIKRIAERLNRRGNDALGS